MTSEQKSYHIFKKFHNELHGDSNICWETAKELGLFMVDEILHALKYDLNNPTNGSIKYYNEVREELLKM